MNLEQFRQAKIKQAAHDCGDRLCGGLPDPTQSVATIARMIDPWQAQLAVARAMVTMGSQPDWDSETIEHVAAPMVKIGHDVGLPTFTANDDEATEFWGSVR